MQINDCGITPLHNYNSDVLKLLIDAGVAVNAKINADNVPLNYCKYASVANLLTGADEIIKGTHNEKQP